MRHLDLPPYESVKQYEGKGNWAIGKYYWWPWRYVYRKKLSMVLDMLADDRYGVILDFGCGPVKIFQNELSKYCWIYQGADRLGDIRTEEQYEPDCIVCASVLEFVDLEVVINGLAGRMAEGGTLIVASPLTNLITNLNYFFCKSHPRKNTHKEVIRAIGTRFDIVEIKKWMGLYYCLKAVKR